MRAGDIPPFLNIYSNRLISIVVPVFNESHNIVNNLDLLIEEVEEYFPQFEILVVSDGSTDDTNMRVFSFKDGRIHLVISEKNMGKGHAVRKGFQRAKGDYVFFIDGGMELHPKEIRIFLGLMALYEADMVIGSKRHPQSRIHYPWFRKVLSWLFQRLIRFMFEVDVTDTQTGIKLFRKEVVDAILPDLQLDRYGFDLEVLMLARIRGYRRVLEAPIRMDYFLKNSRSTPIELLHVFRVGLSLLGDTFKLYWRMRALEKRAPPAA